MCLLIVARHCRPDREVLELGEVHNPDGIGVAYRKKGTVHFSKGITLEELDEILEIEAPPFVVHFRAASAGGKHPGLCHPFPVTKEFNLQLNGTTDAIIAHNGHLMNWQGLALNAFIRSGDKIADGPWSDTRVMAWLAAHNGPNIFTFLDEKVAYLTAKELRVYKAENFLTHKQESGEILLSYDIFSSDAQRYANWWLTRNPNMTDDDEVEDDEQLNKLNAMKEGLKNRLIADELPADVINSIRGLPYKESELMDASFRLDDTKPPYKANHSE